MKTTASGIQYSVPYEIAVVRTLRQTTLEERRAALEAGYYNTELIPQEMIYVDLKTDSGVSSFSTAQLANWMGAGPVESGMEMAPEASRAFVSLSEQLQEIFGFPYVVPVAQGRAAERIWGSCMSSKAQWCRETCSFLLRGSISNPTAESLSM